MFKKMADIITSANFWLLGLANDVFEGLDGR